MNGYVDSVGEVACSFRLFIHTTLAITRNTMHIYHAFVPFSQGLGLP